ncbi:MAG: LysE family translocator [Cellvibrionaceae bacterium]|nr:LysE family translocator [Cellvibrionaceae bacterium]
MEWALVAVFVPTFFLVSISPGMCMTLALTLGMAIGVRRTMWMMAGELLGVISVAALAVLGVAQLLMRWPTAFTVIKIAGGAYLFYIGIQCWLSKGKLAFVQGEARSPGRGDLFMQGLLTACSNPKAWAFNISILPPFLDFDRPITFQLLTILVLIAICEFVSMTIYASGGRSLRYLLERDNGAQYLNRISGSLMIAVAFWMWFF